MCLEDSDPAVSEKFLSICKKKKKYHQLYIYVHMHVIGGFFFLGATSHQGQFIAKLITEGAGHATSYPLCFDILQNQILRPF